MVLALAAAMKLFLDIDGVLHSEPAFFAKAFCWRGILIDLLDARPHLEVVISSDWRLTQSLDEIAMQIVVDQLAGQNAAANAVAAGRRVAGWKDGRLVEYGQGAEPLPVTKKTIK